MRHNKNRTKADALFSGSIVIKATFRIISDTIDAVDKIFR